MKPLAASVQSPLRCESGALVGDWAPIATYRSDRRPAFVPYEGADPARVRKLERGAVRAIERRLAGQSSMHASAVELGGRAVAVVAPAGFGKSTHAAALCILSGGALLADDVAFVDYQGHAVTLEPSEVDHWLDGRASALVRVLSDGGGAKQPTAAGRSCGALRAHLALVVVLENGSPESGGVRRLRGTKAFDLLARAMIHLPEEMELPSSRRRDVDLIAAICRQAVIVAWSPAYEASDGGLPAFVEMVRLFLEGASC